MKKSNIAKDSEMKRIFCDANLIPTKFIKGYYLLVTDLLKTTNIDDNCIIFKELKECISNLERKKQECLSLRYGLYDGNILIYESISKRYNLTRERIRQIIELSFAELSSKKTQYYIPYILTSLKLKKQKIEKEIEYYENLNGSDNKEIQLTLNDFNFTVRGINALARYGIKNYQELIDLTPIELISIKSIGMKTANEIWFKLHGEKIYNYIHPMLGGFEFSTRAINVLLENGIRTYDQLKSLSFKAISDLKGCGEKTASEIWSKVHGNKRMRKITS